MWYVSLTAVSKWHEVICKSLGKDLTVKETNASFAEGAMHQTITIHVIRGNQGSDPRSSAGVLPKQMIQYSGSTLIGRHCFRTGILVGNYL